MGRSEGTSEVGRAGQAVITELSAIYRKRNALRKLQLLIGRSRTGVETGWPKSRLVTAVQDRNNQLVALRKNRLDGGERIKLLRKAVLQRSQQSSTT